MPLSSFPIRTERSCGIVETGMDTGNRGGGGGQSTAAVFCASLGVHERNAMKMRVNRRKGFSMVFDILWNQYLKNSQFRCTVSKMNAGVAQG